ncbi:MAG: methyltransferase domain-containing protein [Ignavibacteriales bacterium]|jgi:SAM-dependent methyltransferase|nr:methyltransferase domain-containing protein [Ignavibacteriales bacterium]
MDSEIPINSNKWFQNWFDSEHYLKLYHGRDNSEAGKLAKLICKSTGIQSGSSVLDLGCGAGRHAIMFSKLGFKVTGYDLSRHLLLEAKSGAICQETKLSLVRGDIRNLPFKSKFDLVLNIFTSWGYFESDLENLAVLKNAVSLKRDGGFFVLDFLNAEYVKKNLIPSSITEFQGVTYSEERSIRDERVIKSIKFCDGNGEKCFKESVRLFDHDQIIEVFKETGVSNISLFGDYDGSRFEKSNSPRIICLVS